MWTGKVIPRDAGARIIGSTRTAGLQGQTIERSRLCTLEMRKQVFAGFNDGVACIGQTVATNATMFND